MTYLLDTNACIDYLNKRNSAIAIRLAKLSTEEVVLCAVVKAELFYGVARCKNPDVARLKLADFLSGFVSLPFDDAAAEKAGALRAKLAANGKPIGPHDVQIAAIALSHGLTVVTHNTREFARVAGLKWEDWQTTVDQ